MLTKATVFLVMLALTAQVAVAAPPACLIAAVNTQPDPSNMQAVCTGNNATEVVNNICNSCGDNVEAALDEFEGACLAAGLNISTDDSCSSDGGSGSDVQTSTQSGDNGGASSTATSTGNSDTTATASQSAGSAEGTNAAMDIGVGSGGITAALLFAALVAF